jgi:hypothetical protein
MKNMFCIPNYKRENMQFLITEEMPQYTACSLLMKPSTASFTNHCRALITTEKI